MESRPADVIWVGVHIGTPSVRALLSELTRRGHLDLAGVDAGTAPTTATPWLNG